MTGSSAGFCTAIEAANALLATLRHASDALDYAQAQMSHTPGPWYCHFAACIEEQGTGDYVDATGICTSSEEEFMRDGGRGDLVAFVPHDGPHQANSRLIAAAPEMLRMLRVIRLTLEEMDDDAVGWRNLDATYMDALIAGTFHEVNELIFSAQGRE
jgi:hypothetical protein